MTALGAWAGYDPDHPLASAERLFRQLAGERLDTLSAAWMHLDPPHDGGQARTTIAAVAKKVSGTAASLGHARLGAAAERVEALVAQNARAAELRQALHALMAGLADLSED